MCKNDSTEREKAILAGELDDEMPSLREFKYWLQRMPMDYLHELLFDSVQVCIIKGVFVSESALLGIVNRAIERTNHILYFGGRSEKREKRTDH